MNEGQVLHNSPYVAQIEKFADSLKQLSRTFLELEEKKQAFSNEEIEDMFQRVREKVCGNCEKCSWCWGENFVHTYQMGYEILSAVDRYGNEMNMETKRKLQQKCIMAPRFLREMLEAFHRCQTEYDLDKPNGKEQRRVRDPDGYLCRYDTQYGKRIRR